MKANAAPRTRSSRSGRSTGEGWSSGRPGSREKSLLEIPDPTLMGRQNRSVGSQVNGSNRSEPDDLVVVHVERRAGTCGACGSDNVLEIHVSEEGSPVWVRVCADCDEHVWSLDG